MCNYLKIHSWNERMISKKYVGMVCISNGAIETSNCVGQIRSTSLCLLIDAGKKNDRFTWMLLKYYLHYAQSKTLIKSIEKWHLLNCVKIPWIDVIFRRKVNAMCNFLSCFFFCFSVFIKLFTFHQQYYGLSKWFSDETSTFLTNLMGA